MRSVPVTGPTRENFAVLDAASGNQYRLVFPGASLTVAGATALPERCGGQRKGRKPSGGQRQPPTGNRRGFLSGARRSCGALGCAARGRHLRSALRQLRGGVYLLKRSVRELGQCVGRELRERDEQIAAARLLITAGVTRIVVLSLGAAGALAVTADSAEWFAPIAEPVISGIGAGDAMVGGSTRCRVQLDHKRIRRR